MYVPLLSIHPVIKRFGEMCTITSHGLAHKAIHMVALARQDSLFSSGEMATHMYVQVSGDDSAFCNAF